MPAALAALRERELVLGRYRPVRPLGSGGSGSVWLAWDEQGGLEVALKVVSRDGKAAARAEREAAAAARLRHEHCLRAYTCSSDDQHVYIAYEYVRGRTLREALRGELVTDRQAVEAAAQVAEGLAHAHGRGVVHRDVKPANVLLQEGEQISVRLADFGLAQFADAETLTAVGDVPGTLAYIAPERLAGDPGSAAGDVWSVGVLLWEALAGRHPFWSSSLLGTAKRIKAGAPPLATARPDLPRAVTQIVDRALSLDPRRRPSAAALARALQNAWAERDERTRRHRPRVPRPKMRARPGALVAALLAAAAAGWSASALPFFPQAWVPGLAALAAGATLVSPLLGLGLVLAVPVLPLGNVSTGLAVAYALAALAWLVLFARDARAGLGFVAGPLLALAGLLPMLPLALLPVRRWTHRAAAAAVGVLTAVAVASVRQEPLPLSGAPEKALPLHRTEDPVAAARAVWEVLPASPAIVWEAAALGAAAGFARAAAARGPWAVAALGAALLVLLLVPTHDVAALPVVASVWLLCGGLVIFGTAEGRRLLRSLRSAAPGGPVAPLAVEPGGAPHEG